MPPLPINTMPQGTVSTDSEDALKNLYAWLDEIDFSRPKRNLYRDFCDGVLMAEVVDHCIPKLVHLHNYSAANSLGQKIYNWTTLNEKVFRRVGMHLTEADIQDVANAKPGTIEGIIFAFKKCAESWPSRMEMVTNCSDTDKETPKNIEFFNLLSEKDQTILELQETKIILQAKTESLQKLLNLRDAKIKALTHALEEAKLRS